MADRDAQRYMKNVNKLFGGRLATSAGKSPQRRTKSPRQTAKPTAGRLTSFSRKRQHANQAGDADKQIIHWQHYENIFCAMDNLKYQFPALGYERFFDMFTALFTFYLNGDVAYASSEIDNDLTVVNDDQVKWVSSFGIDPSYYGRLTASDLYQRLLLPVFGAACGTFAGAALEKITVNGRGIASCFSCNSLLSRLVKCTRVLLTNSPACAVPERMNASRLDAAAGQQDKAGNQTASASIDDRYEEDGHNENAGEAMDFSDPPARFAANVDIIAVQSQVKNRPAKAKSPRISAVGGARQQTISQQVKQDAKRYNAHLMELSVHSTEPIWCDCCIYSYRIVLAFDDHNDGINWRAYFRSMACPAVYVNARVLLCWPLTYPDFVRDFKLGQRTKTADINQSRAFLHKTRAIYNMGFYKRINSLHLWIYFIVMWLWTCQRAVHERCALSTDNGSYGTFATGTFPVHLLIQKKLRKIFDVVPSLPLAKLLKTRKLLLQYI